jgi:hypothetical protein
VKYSPAKVQRQLVNAQQRNKNKDELAGEHVAE